MYAVLISVLHYSNRQYNTSTPVVRTYIPTCRSPSPQTVYNTGRHWASGGLFLTRSATVGQVCHTGLMTVKRVIDFSIFDLGGLPLGQRSPKGEMTYYPPRSTILQNFSPIAQTVYEICVTKVFTFWLRGLTPGPKFTERGEDLVASQIYHPAKFHCPTTTHARDIRYQISCGQTNKLKNKQ